MQRIKRLVIWTLMAVALMFTGRTSLQAQTQSEGSTTPVDNTKTNARDREKNAPTADQQKDNRSDREVTREIRRSLVKDKALSSYAHNVKIITRDGQVTLKGPVRSDEEKRAVEAKATEIAGENKVISQLDVKPKQ
ncbi:MAG: hypothetical protein NVS1B11_19680 [Terriglobales bacterium]